MKTFTLTLLVCFTLTLSAGCATNQHDEADVQKAISAAQVKRAEADKAKSDAIATLAAGSGDSARVAGIMALVMSGQQSAAPTPQVIQSRRSTTEVVIDGVIRLLGLGVQYHGIEAGKDVSIQASRDRAATDQAAFDALATVAGNIQAPQANQTMNQTLSGPGVIGSGSYSAPVTTTETDLAWEASTTTTDTTSSTSSTSSSDTNSSYNTSN